MTRLRRLLRHLPLAAEAAVLLTVSTLAVKLLPAPRVTRLLGQTSGEGASDQTAESAKRARRVGWTVERVAGVLPWHPVCLPQAVAARWMLRRRGIACVSHLGITNARPLTAHAWVTVGDVVVQGGSVAGIPELAIFR